MKTLDDLRTKSAYLGVRELIDVASWLGYIFALIVLLAGFSSVYAAYGQTNLMAIGISFIQSLAIAASTYISVAVANAIFDMADVAVASVVKPAEPESAEKID